MKSLFYFSLLYNITLLTAMNNDVVITQPYQPSFSGRHCQLVNNMKASGAAVFAAFATLGLQEQLGKEPTYLVNPFTVGVTTFSMMKMFETKRRLIDSIIVDPHATLNYLYAVNEKFEREGEHLEMDEKDASEALPLYAELVEKYEQECPIFLLGECTAEDFGPCLLSRSHCPKYRDEFEAKIKSSLIEGLNNDRPLNYTDFGSGGAFQVLVTLTKVLSQKPNAKLMVHLIDHNYTPFVVCRDFLDKTRELKSQDSYDLMPVMPRLISHAREKWGAGRLAESKIESSIKIDYAATETRRRQVIRWLRRTFPNATLSLYLHDTTESYIEYLEKHQMAYPDVISAADIQDEMSLMKKSLYDYGVLCRKTLKMKEGSTNILLAKDHEKSKGTLMTISLNRISNLSEEEVVEDSTTVPKEKIYITRSPIE